jgi:hypothetical protein
MCNTVTFLMKSSAPTVQAIAAILMIAAVAPEASASRIDQVSISGQFTDATGAHNMPNTFFKFGNHILNFGGTAVAFDIDFLRTDKLSTNHYSDVVKISYPSLFGTGFLARPGALEFDGHDKDGKLMSIDAVVDYTKAGFLSAGWVLNSTLPANAVAFHTQQGNIIPLTNGATNSAFFTLDYSFTTPIPSTFPLLATGLGALGLVGWRKGRRLA